MKSNEIAIAVLVAACNTEPHQPAVVGERAAPVAQVHANLAGSADSQAQQSGSTMRAEDPHAIQHDAGSQSPQPPVSVAADRAPYRRPRERHPPVVADEHSPGKLRVNTRPWSKVYVDGQFVGNTPVMNYSLPPGTHRVLLVNEDLGIRHEVKIEVSAGQVVTLVLNLSEYQTHSAPPRQAYIR